MGLKPSTIDGSALEASRESLVGTKLTLYEATDSRALSLIEDQGSVPGLELRPIGGKAERMMSGCVSRSTKTAYLVTGSLPSTGGALGR